MHDDRADAGSTTVTPSATRLAIDQRRLPWMRRLALDYVHRFDALAPFYAGNPIDPAAWADAIARSRAHARQSDRIAAIVQAQQQRRHAPPAAVERARQLADPGTFAVLTGQQAGLFGGPLYTLLKAITAIKLAAQVSREHGVAAVAVFWVDAEDHDWNEVRACSVFDHTVSPQTVALPARADADSAPVAAVRLDGSIEGPLGELEQFLPPTEFRSRLLADLRLAYESGAGMADAFARWLERVLGERGLVVYDASDSGAKALLKDVFTQEVSTAGRTASLASETGARLASLGYHAQVQPQEDSLALFRLNRARQPIRRRNGQFVIGDALYEPTVLLDWAASQPENFSPNVLLRPIVQDALFPTICYVAGPSELAYLGQLRPVYEHFGVPMPLVFPRVTATMADSAAIRFLTKYDVPFEALQAQDEAALNDLLRAQIPATVEARLQEAGQAVGQHMTRLAEALPALDPTLEGAARSTLAKMQHDLETLQGKIIQAAKRRDETLRRQFIRTRALAFPGGHPQERVIGFVSFLNQYGPALIDRLFDDLPLDLGYHWVVAI